MKSVYWALSIFTQLTCAVPIAEICNGTLRGRYLPEFHQDLFLGVPFANAPRLDNPTSLTKKYNSLDASSYGTTCYGFGTNTLLNLTQGEDCLNLNVVRPSGTTYHSRLPVLLWIYGGGFNQGSNADPMWNLSYVVQTSVQNKQPVIAVSINYRLSFLGFPGGKQSIDSGITNLGLKDQRIALHWVHENINAFGGDPEKVTIWGESAGAISVADQLIAFGGKDEGLFRGAIMVSGFTTGINPGLASDTQKGYDAIVANANCTNAISTLECLRTAPLSAIYPFENTAGTWRPVIDGDIIRRAPFYELVNGNVVRVPILLGENSDEGLFLSWTLAPFVNGFNTTSDVVNSMRFAFPGLRNTTIDAILATYPEEGPAPPYSVPIDYPWCAAMAQAKLPCGNQYRRAAAFLGDIVFHSGRRLMADAWDKFGLDAYSFRFDTAPTTFPIVYWNNLGPGFAEHGTELAYEFGLPAGYTSPPRFYPPVRNVSSHIAVSHAMVSKWVAFAYTGDPNSFSCRYSSNTDNQCL